MALLLQYANHINCDIFSIASRNRLKNTVAIMTPYSWMKKKKWWTFEESICCCHDEDRAKRRD